MKFLSLLIIFVLSFNVYALEYKAYNFAELSSLLGYPDETYFGSDNEEITALEVYTSKEDTFYKEINNFLRFYPRPYEWNGIGPTGARRVVDGIDRIFTKIPSIPEDLILFRGIDLSYRKNKSFAIGEEFNELGYVSTSTTFSVANYFATEIVKSNSKKAIFVLYQSVPGHKGILIDQDEDEVLLKHNQLLKIMSVSRANQAFESYLVQVCKSICDQKTNTDIEKFWKNFKQGAQ